MAKVTFSSDINIKPQRQTFPKLSGLKNDEKVRIQLMNTEDIDMDYVHNLQAPVIVDGRPEFDADGKHKMAYKGSPLSFGDLSILENKGLDPANCPISKMAKEHPDWVAPPKRKFAMHIIQYRTKPGTFELQAPYKVDHKVWVFTEKTYLKLREFQNEWGDLRKHDLLITCTNQQFQQFDISVAGKAAWLSTNDKADAQQTQSEYQAGIEAYPDLSLAIGQRKEREWVIKDLEEIAEAWRIADGQATNAGFAGGGFGSAGDSSGSSDDDILNSLTTNETESGGDTSFDDLLAGLTG